MFRPIEGIRAALRHRKLERKKIFAKKYEMYGSTPVGRPNLLGRKLWNAFQRTCLWLDAKSLARKDGFFGKTGYISFEGMSYSERWRYVRSLLDLGVGGKAYAGLRTWGDDKHGYTGSVSLLSSYMSNNSQDYTEYAEAQAKVADRPSHVVRTAHPRDIDGARDCLRPSVTFEEKVRSEMQVDNEMGQGPDIYELYLRHRIEREDHYATKVELRELLRSELASREDWIDEATMAPTAEDWLDEHKEKIEDKELKLNVCEEEDGF